MEHCIFSQQEVSESNSHVQVKADVLQLVSLMIALKSQSPLS